jgi:hypothetical protein
VLYGAAMVFYMQAGFALLEVGSGERDRGGRAGRDTSACTHKEQKKSSAGGRRKKSKKIKYLLHFHFHNTQRPSSHRASNNPPKPRPSNTPSPLLLPPFSFQTPPAHTHRTAPQSPSVTPRTSCSRT